ncbi:MAG: hypothetical protein KUL88_02235, partial [Rhizobium sp.]|nr:hypothetical protein [Rhizobium sp.]
RKAAEAAEPTVTPPAGDAVAPDPVSPTEPQLPGPPGEGVTRGGALPPVELRFEGVPGVN